MKTLFAPPDIEYDSRCLKKYFLDNLLSGDDAYLDEDEIAAREAIFDKLAELADVMKDVKIKSGKGKSG